MGLFASATPKMTPVLLLALAMCRLVASVPQVQLGGTLVTGSSVQGNAGLEFFGGECQWYHVRTTLTPLRHAIREASSRPSQTLPTHLADIVIWPHVQCHLVQPLLPADPLGEFSLALHHPCPFPV